MRALLSLLVLVAGCQEYNLNRGPDRNGVGNDDTDPDVSTGPQPDIEVSPAELTFGSWPLDCPSEWKTVTVRNVGEADLEVTSIALAGGGESMFALTGGPVTLAPGASSTFDVRFTATAFGEFTVAAQITSNDPDEGVAEVGVRGAGAEDRIYEEMFEQPARDAVDVLWVVDNSGSMSEEVSRLQASFRYFISSFVSLGLDYQIGVVTTDMDNPVQQGRLQGIGVISPSTTSDVIGAFTSATDQGSSGSGSEKGFAASKAALTEPLLSTTSAGLVRDDAQLAVIVISDEDDDSSMPARDYAAWLNGYKGDPTRTSFSAIAGGRGLMGCMKWIGLDVVEADPSPLYVDATELTDGSFAEICDEDFDAVLEYLSYTAAGLSRVFRLTERPSNVAAIKVKVDGRDVRYHGIDGWTWLPAENSIQFNGSSVPGPEAVIDVSYPVATECH